MTNTPPIGPPTTSSQWVDRLANLVHAIRQDWDEPGIRSALRKVADRPLAQVATAALIATGRVDQRTPAVIAMDGDHWRAAGGPRLPEPIRCAFCWQPGPEACARAQALVLNEADRMPHTYAPHRPRRREATRPMPDWKQVLPSVEDGLA